MQLHGPLKMLVALQVQPDGRIKVAKIGAEENQALWLEKRPVIVLVRVLQLEKDRSDKEGRFHTYDLTF